MSSIDAVYSERMLRRDAQPWLHAFGGLARAVARIAGSARLNLLRAAGWQRQIVKIAPPAGWLRALMLPP